MNLATYSNLENAAYKIADASNFPLFSSNFADLDKIYSFAKNLVKKQNYALRTGHGDDIIRSYELMCEESGCIVRVNIRANRQLTTMQWFQLEVAKEQYLTRQQIRKLVFNK